MRTVTFGAYISQHNEVTTKSAFAAYPNRISAAVESLGSQAIRDLGVVFLWAFIGLALSLFVGVSDFGVDLTAVLAVAE